MKLLSRERRGLSTIASAAVALIIIVGALAAGYSALTLPTTSTPSSGTTPASGKLVDVTLGFAGPPDVTDTPGFALWQTYAKQLGLNVHVQYFDSDQGPQQALITGAIDFAEGGFQAVIQVDEANGNSSGSFPNIAIASYEATNDYAFVVEKSITNFSQLANQPIAAGHLGVSSYIFCVDLLSKLGNLPPSEINCVPVGGTSSRAQDMFAGKVVGTLLEPFNIVQAIVTGKFSILATIPQLYPNLLFNVISTSSAYAKAHPDTVLKMTEAAMLADRWAHNETQWIAQEQTEFPGTNTTQAGAAWKLWMAMNFWAPNGGISFNSLNSSEAFELKAKAVQYYLAPKYWSDMSLQTQALQVLGNYTGPALGYPDSKIPTMSFSIPGVSAIIGALSIQVTSSQMLSSSIPYMEREDG